MRRINVMRVALVGLLGCAAGAPGQDIPVYREYTQPVLFYDEQGKVTAFNAAGPDLAALQSVRDVKAREGLMGKETLLDLTFESGSSVFGGQAPLTGKMAPMVDNGEDRRSQQNDSGRNWLAKSLSLPSLGQTPTNAAESVMSPGAKESSWGWLADDVAGQQDGAAALPQELQLEEEYNPVAAQENAIMGGKNSFGTDRAATQAEKKDEAVEQEPSTSAAFPESAETGQKPSDQAIERSEASARDMEGGDRMASPTIKDYRTFPVAEMSQTRQIISELSVGSQPDFSSSFRATEMDAPADSGGGAEREMAGRTSLGFSSSAGGATDWGAMDSHQDIGSSSMGAASPVGSSWSGGWSAQNAGGGGSVLSRFESPSDPTPVPVVPVPPPGSSLPGTSSGGYKPAWF